MTGAGATAVPYPLDNHHGAAPAYLGALAELLDPVTRGRIDALDWRRAGARCLEVGAGAGSIASWLADQVGPGGEVIACDLKPDHLPAHPRLTPVGYDLTSDLPWPEPMSGPFDLICARLTLAHLPNRRTLAHRLAGLLDYGGLLLVEDWADPGDRVVVAAPSREAAELYEGYQHTASEVFAQAGTDPSWARRLHPTLIEEGLIEVDTVISGGYWTGGGPGCRQVVAAMFQLTPRLLAGGLTVPQLDRLADLLADPQLVIHGPPLYSCSGRRARSG